MQFAPNQRVIFIDDAMYLIKGKIYTVRAYNPDGELLLFGISIFTTDGRECGWKDTRFKPVDDWAYNVLEKISHDTA